MTFLKHLPPTPQLRNLNNLYHIRTMKLHSLIFLLTLSWLVPAFTYSQSDDLDTKAVQERIKERLPSVVALKVEGKLGEARNGLLAIRGELTEEQAKLVHLENKDRRAIYEYMAKKFDIPVPQVAMSRAAKIREQATEGTWIQEKGGAWVKKIADTKE